MPDDLPDIPYVYGLTTASLPKNSTPLEAVAVVKVIGPNGIEMVVRRVTTPEAPALLAAPSSSKQSQITEGLTIESGEGR